MRWPPRPHFSFAEYVRIESMSPIRHEWLDGTVWAMAGGTPEHSSIAVNVSTQFADRQNVALGASSNAPIVRLDAERDCVAR